MSFQKSKKRYFQSSREHSQKLKEDADLLSDKQLDLLFGKARSMNGWKDEDVSNEILYSLYELTKMGPTSTNSCPARFVFIKSEEMKEKIKPALLPNNVDKCMTAPVITIIGYDLDFSEHMGKLFPHMDVAPMYKGNSDMNFATAFRNSSLQGAYLMIVARALGLDCGPMSGFNNELVDEQFFSGTNIKSNFLCCLGYGDPSKIFMRLPRFEFDEVCKII